VSKHDEDEEDPERDRRNDEAIATRSLLPTLVSEPRPTAFGTDRIDLALDVEAELPPVSCDRDRVVQVLENLASNAIHATQTGTVTLRASRAEGSVRLEVLYTGPGIPDDEIPSLFDRYQRGSGAAYRGSGLGLYIAKGIVEAHGGTLLVESRVGTGSAFSFSLPVPAPRLLPRSRGERGPPTRG
jgi:signal transduction histidine kinase